MRFTRFIFILCIAAFVREHKLWRRDPSEIKGPTEMHGYYEEDPTTINVRFSLRFIDDHKVEMYGNGEVWGPMCTYTIKQNNVVLEHACGTMFLEIQGDVLYDKADDRRYRLRR